MKQILFFKNLKMKNKSKRFSYLVQLEDGYTIAIFLMLIMRA